MADTAIHLARKLGVTASADISREYTANSSASSPEGRRTESCKLVVGAIERATRRTRRSPNRDGAPPLVDEQDIREHFAAVSFTAPVTQALDTVAVHLQAVADDVLASAPVGMLGAAALGAFMVALARSSTVPVRFWPPHW